MVSSYPFLLYVSTFGSLLGSILFGFHMAVLNPSLEQVLKDLKHEGNMSATMSEVFDSKGTQSEEGQGTLVVSAVLLGALVGATITSHVADRVGPKAAILYFAPCHIIGLVLSGMARTLMELASARVLCGIGVGKWCNRHQHMSLLCYNISIPLVDCMQAQLAF